MNKHKTMKALMSAMVAAMLLLPATAGAQRVGGDERQDDLYRQAMDLYQQFKRITDRESAAEKQINSTEKAGANGSSSDLIGF